MSSTTRNSMTLALSILIVGVALAAYAFMPVSTFAADPGNGTITSPPVDAGGEQGDGGGDNDNDNPPVANNNDTSPTTPDQAPTSDPSIANNENQTAAATPDLSGAANNDTGDNDNATVAPSESDDTTAAPEGNNGTTATAPENNDDTVTAPNDSMTNNNPSENGTTATNSGENNTITTVPPENNGTTATTPENKDNNNNTTATSPLENNSDKGSGSNDDNKPQNSSNNGGNDDSKQDGSNHNKPERKLYDDSKDYQGPKYYKYKHHDNEGAQADDDDGRVGEHYSSHHKKFFKYKHDFTYYENVKIIIYHFYFKDFVGADFFVHFDYEHHDGNVLIFFDHPFKDHEYDDEGRFYFDEDGNEYQCDEYYQGSVYYEYKNAFYKCEDLTFSEDFEGGY
ncbi:hypothetical protein NTE_03078 [Candidatus Nitrososphaera evergladensis SR1]|uniref:Uncharacterized protein n=1 Tax=Candidatus Nitrososphaera evergladensis SR1 TaxID=1459636 RepID=A0A075MWT7_9ARCH|nr:hypothetical protein [Candidatus Nitrososphaera evergladensis]AIF85112.1 hypothetical protein NTE_03078 [Candidatus Nitrososphaera evergladensis SR1]